MQIEMVRHAHDERDGSGQALARGLGLFSIGLGLAEVAAPDRVANLIGVERDERTIDTLVACGVREVVNGVALLAQPERSQWRWSRVFGDAIDLALLASATRNERTDGARLTGALLAVAGVAALDVFASTKASTSVAREERAGGHRIAAPRIVAKTTSILREPEEVYALWRDFERLPTFMAHLVSVQDLGEGRSHWVARAPAGRTVEWDAEIVEDVPGRRIAWRSCAGAGIENTGLVSFLPSPDGMGTEVHVEVEYRAPAGAAGATFAKLFGKEPGQQIDADLRRLKQVLETGEIMRSDASIHHGKHPARPSADARRLL
jgi:uncharacterized membrane protein